MLRSHHHRLGQRDADGAWGGHQGGHGCWLLKGKAHQELNNQRIPKDDPTTAEKTTSQSSDFRYFRL